MIRTVRAAAAVALAVLIAGGPAWARKGDLVPLAGKGVAVESRDGKKHSVTRLGPLSIEFEVSSGSGFFFVEARVTNTSSSAFTVEPNQLTVSSGGSDVDPLDPDNYIELAYQVKPLPVDKKGKIVEEKGHVPVKVFTPGAQVPGTSSGASLAEQMASDQWEEGSHQQRVDITKELLALKKDVLRYGGTIPPGKSVKGKLIYQRNQLELPADVHMIVGTKKLTVRFVREK